MAVMHITPEIETQLEVLRVQRGYKYPYQVIEELLKQGFVAQPDPERRAFNPDIEGSNPSEFIQK